MYYFSFVTHQTAAKNNLEKDVQAYLKAKSRHVIEDADLETFKEQVITAIHALNLKHNRCQPTAPKWQRHILPKSDWYLYTCNCTFVLYISQD